MHPQSSKITQQPAQDPRFKSVLDELTQSCLALCTEMCEIILRFKLIQICIGGINGTASASCNLSSALRPT